MRKSSRPKPDAARFAYEGLDRVIHEIISNLRKGQPARFPGLGSFSPGEKWRFQFEAEELRSYIRSP